MFFLMINECCSGAADSSKGEVHHGGIKEW